MPPSSNLRNILLLNLSILCISTSGLLARSVQMTAIPTIFWRALLASCLFLVVLRWQKIRLPIANGQHLRIILFGGVLMAAHWVTYFQSLQLSSVAIGMLSLFTYPVITAILEPLLLKTRFQPIHIGLGALTLVGLYLLIPSFSAGDHTLQAVGWGVLSAALYAWRNVSIKPLVAQYAGSHIMTYQIMVIALVLLPYVLWQGGAGIAQDWPYILLLAIITTIVGHSLLLYSFRFFSVTTASIISSIQPVYGIILGAIFLQEYPGWNIYLGGGLILVAVVVESLRTKKVT